jgi:PAS domain S-box-containing protein
VNAIYGLFLVALLETVLGVIVLVRSPHRPVNRWFAAFAVNIAVWGTGVALRRVVSDPMVALLVLRTTFAAGTLTPVTFFHFVRVFPRPATTNPRFGEILTVAGLFISGLAFSPWIVADVQAGARGLEPVYGPLHPLFAIFFLITFTWGFVQLVRKRHRLSGFMRAQLNYVFLGTALATAGATITNVVVPLLVGPTQITRYGPYFTLLLVGSCAHSIVRHRLMNVRVFISRSAAYAAGWMLAAGLLVGGGLFLDTMFRERNPTLTPLGSAILGLAVSVLFIGFMPRLRRLADRYLYRPAYDAAQLAREGSRVMGTLADPAHVASAMGQLLDRALHLESLAIVVQDRPGEPFLPVARWHVDAAFGWPEALPGAAPLAVELRRTASALVGDDLASRSATREAGALTADLQAWNAQVAVPVRDGELVAVILCGAKLSGDPFFQEDLSLLETLASELAIGLKNAQLYREIVAIKEYNERILTHMDSGVIAIREDGVVTTFNAAAERILGVPAGRILGRPLDTLDPAIRGVLRGSLVEHSEIQTEVAVTHPEGRVLPLVVLTSALHDPRGEVSGAIAVINDHSRLKALEEDKRRAERLSGLGALATGIAHEIRNPLVAIKTFAELLPERADDQEFRSTFAKVAVKEIHRIEQLLGRLRALAVPSAFALRPLDPKVPLGETIDLLRGEADRRRVRFVVEIERELPPILAEPDQLKQLFLNLFLNGLEAMTAGGTLTVTVRADRERGDRERAGRGIVTVRVTDTGPGIPREDLGRVFEPFFTTKSKGTGLGLAISRSIADAHRAALWAETGPAGIGTTFVIQFPALVGAPIAEAIRPEVAR